MCAADAIKTNHFPMNHTAIDTCSSPTPMPSMAASTGHGRFKVALGLACKMSTTVGSAPDLIEPIATSFTLAIALVLKSNCLSGSSGTPGESVEHYDYIGAIGAQKAMGNGDELGPRPRYPWAFPCSIAAVFKPINASRTITQASHKSIRKTLGTAACILNRPVGCNTVRWLAPVLGPALMTLLTTPKRILS